MSVIRGPLAFLFATLLIVTSLPAAAGPAEIDQARAQWRSILIRLGDAGPAASTARASRMFIYTRGSVLTSKEYAGALDDAIDELVAKGYIVVRRQAGDLPFEGHLLIRNREFEYLPAFYTWREDENARAERFAAAEQRKSLIFTVVQWVLEQMWQLALVVAGSVLAFRWDRMGRDGDAGPPSSG